ncbi:MAG: ABC transporter permease [Bacteroidales bacterium]|jgi:putative ABC transport system permease protein|nr:ABC transporter permease [Bacteroidales bacterium]MDI9575979.1 ABC transporter permease [Bacteroidota bacterium]MDD2594060.1 ABC transporter permease [Bacteroidales bacterium]MDD3754999.1 ABC transporter permease [Bacteroidales bacterium]MDY0400189.1 ABC transporter permease [Bacteroidales bacterium]
MIWIFIKEAIAMAWHSLKSNKLRTILTISGITIGIFSIIAVLTVIDSIKNQVNTSIASLGSDALFIQKWPWSFDADMPWWKYVSRPNTSYREYLFLKNYSETIGDITYTALLNTKTSSHNITKSNQSIIGITTSYANFFPFIIKEGRMFTLEEVEQGSSVCILGYEAAINYFGTTKIIGQTIKIGSQKLNIVGVLEKEGENILAGSNDKLIFVPVLFLRNFIKLDSDEANPYISVKPKPNYTQEDLKNEVRFLLRQYRRLPPKKEDDFTINTATMLTQSVEGIFKSMTLGGWIIGGFALLVGGFGIANIMFVSIKERTQQIGIQKALGAKNRFILLQFLFESVFLSIIGGLIGLLLVLILSIVLKFLINFAFPLTFENIITGIIIATVTGILAGIVPALQASKLDPVEAMRKNV